MSQAAIIGAGGSSTCSAAFTRNLSIKTTSSTPSQLAPSSHLVFCRIKVNQIEDQDCWWCNSNTCKYEVSILDGAFKCINCTKLIPVPQKRYRLCIIAEDETDACNVILQDMAVKRIVGVTATKLKAEMDKDKPESKDLPYKIKNIVGKEYTLVIDIHKDNILSDSNIYYADDICDFKSANEVSNSNFSKAEQYSLSVNETSSTALEINTPGTAKSSSKTRSRFEVANEFKEIPHEGLNKKIKQEKEV